jgi:hypothetical protein
MNISPKRRRRIQREHQLRQNGHTLESIADKLKVSIATVHADLRLLETDWDDFAQSLHNDLLLQQITRVNRRIARLNTNRPPGAELCQTFEERLRLEALYVQTLNAANRELRMLLRQLAPDARRANGEIIDIELAEYPDEELVHAEQPRNHLKKPESPQAAIAQKTQEHSDQAAQEKSSPENLNPNLPRNTGRNKPCPCGSGQKRKHCHPQHLSAPPLGEMSRSSPPPDIEAEVFRLTQQFEAADRNNDELTQVSALEKLAALPGK